MVDVVSDDSFDLSDVVSDEDSFVINKKKNKNKKMNESDEWLKGNQDV